MADLMEYVNVLADQIGPRPVSTEEEHQASLYIAQELSDNGLDVSVDEFATPSGVRWPYVIAYAAAAFGTFISGIGVFVPGISLSMFILGLILVLAGLFIFYTEESNQPILSKMRANGVSQNVVAKYVPEGMARESRRRKKIIIAAHVDTVRVRPEDSPKIVAHAPLLHKILFYCMIGLPIVLFVRLLPLPWPDVIDTILWVISLAASVFVLADAVCIIASKFTPYISGGNDNASSISVLLSVARLLTHPDERERYTRSSSMGQVLGIEEEYLDDEEEPDPFAPKDGEAEELPVIHSAQEAYAEGLVPEDVELVYDDDGTREDATVAFGALTPEQQLDVLADTAAEELHLDTVSTGAFSLDDVEFEEKDAAEVEPVRPGAISDMDVPDLDFTLDEEIERVQKEPAERLDDSVIFAEYMGNDNPAQPEPEAEPQQEAAAPAEVLEVEAIEEEAMVDEEEEPVAEEPPSPAPIYVPIETKTRTHEEAEEAPQVARPVPSWYAAAKQKAAKDLEKKSGPSNDPGDEEVFSYRSRFADAPAARGGRAAQVEEEVVEVEPETVEAVEESAPQETVAAVVEVQETVEQAQPAEEAHVSAEEAEQLAEVKAAIDLDISEDDLEELSPDSSGLFEPVNLVKEVQTTHRSATERVQLTSRIPNIGSSDDKERHEKKSAQESRAARGSRPELSSIPDVTDDDITIDAEGFTEFEGSADFGIQDEQPIEPVIPASAKVSRKKPTARHVTQSFVPTRATGNRDIALGDNRQVAPVPSEYEDTVYVEEGGDPFAPKDEEPVQSPRTSHRHAPRQRTEFTVASSVQASSESFVSPGATSSFPALTGAFPAITDVPMVDAEDFQGVDDVMIADETAIDSFTSAGQTSQINIPESRFRNAVDKVGGLFNRKGKDADGLGFDDSQDSWADDDDLGWKGGAYFDQDAEDAYEAVRQRAAQLRESVVSMTETDLMDKEVWFVALGASSADAQGMKNFLDLHASELRGSLIINLEAVGAGSIGYVESEGTGKPHRGDRRLIKLMKKASKDVRGTEMKAKTLDWRNTDATPAMIAGMRALTVMGFADNGVAPVDWHTVEDTAYIVEEDKLEYMTRVLLNVIENS